MRPSVIACFILFSLLSPSLARAEGAATTGEIAQPEKPKITEEVHGSVYFWYYQPLQAGVKNSLSLYAAILDVDVKFDDFGFHFEPRFRDTPLRSYFQSNVWVQEAYAFYKQDSFIVKAGKIYTHFGYFWDDSFYGNIQYFDGLKLSPDQGVSLEGNYATNSGFKNNYYLQFFGEDGTTNGSLPTRDTVSVSGAHKRNEAVVRAEPGYDFTKASSVVLGLSGQYFQADLPGLGLQPVYRDGVDLSYSLNNNLRVWTEFDRQNGQSVTAFPSAGVISKHNNYYLAGAEYSFGKIALRYNFSKGDYGDLDYHETLNIPAISYQIHSNITLLFEYANWRKSGSLGSGTIDNSLNFILNTYF